MTTKTVLKVLVVEDDQNTATSLASLIRLSGWNATVAKDGLAALEAIKAAEPDVIFLDLGLPGMHGLDVAKWLTDRKSEKPPFVVAITGHGEDDDRRRAAQAGIDLFLVKPARPDELLELLMRFQRVIEPHISI